MFFKEGSEVKDKPVHKNKSHIPLTSIRERESEVLWVYINGIYYDILVVITNSFPKYISKVYLY